MDFFYLGQQLNPSILNIIYRYNDSAKDSIRVLTLLMITFSSFYKFDQIDLINRYNGSQSDFIGADMNVYFGSFSNVINILCAISILYIIFFFSSYGIQL